MQKVSLLILVLVVCSCAKSDQELIGGGKWYTYADSGDYMELWIGEHKAISYLSSIDEFLLYDLQREGKKLKFSLIESRVINEHSFELEVLRKSQQLMQTTFTSQTRFDSMKTYFLVAAEVPALKGSLQENQAHLDDLFERLEESHAGHDH